MGAEGFHVENAELIRVGGAQAQRLRVTDNLLAFQFSRDVPAVKKVAVSGGIGVGKSTISAALKPFALAFADADELARQVVAPGSPALADIRRRFGDDVFHSDGSLNRAVLARIVFSDESARADLESFTHPRIAQMAHEILDVPGFGFTVYDIPLLVNADDASAYDEVIIVAAPLEERLLRLEKRGLSRQDAQRRIEAQISDEQRRHFASIFVNNTGTSEDLAILGQRIAQEWLVDSCR